MKLKKWKVASFLSRNVYKKIAFQYTDSLSTTQTSERQEKETPDSRETNAVLKTVAFLCLTKILGTTHT